MNSIANLLPALRKAYPNISFQSGDMFRWSPEEKLITYTSHQANAEHGIWALLHEIAHAELNHHHYKSDFSLLLFETSAWQHAHKIARRYHIEIDKDYVQDCLDTYRDWLHRRASCPVCGVVSLQCEDLLYQCFNCHEQWRVPRSPLCRIVRIQA